MIKLICCDMDGTLLNDEKCISKKNIDTIKEVKKQGGYFVMTSGRNVNGLEKYLEYVHVPGIEDYSICQNGSLVLDFERNIIYKKGFYGAEFKEFLELGNKYDVAVEGSNKEEFIVNKINEIIEKNAILNSTEVQIRNISDIDDEDFFAMVTFCDTEEKLDEIEIVLREKFSERFTIVRSLYCYLDVTPIGVSKWHGIKQLAEYLNVKDNEIMTIGDEMNDYEMISNCENSVAMENGNNVVKKIAKYITKSNNESGVAFALETFVLNQKK